MEFETFEIKQATSNKYISNNGSKYLDEYEYRFDKNGVKKLVLKDSKINVYDRIQADYDSTDINKLMLRFSLGDTEALNVRSGQFIDVTQMPNTLAEVFDKAQQAENYFRELPTDVKELFNNSASEFFSQYGTKEFDAKIEKYNDRFVNHQYESNKEVESIKEPSEFVEVER